MNEKKNSTNNELSLEALETELRQMSKPAVPAGLEGKLLANMPAGKRTPRVWYRFPLVRAAAAAVVVMGALGLFAWLMGGNGGGSLAFADVLEQIRKGKIT